jgi:hypothetical protein
MSTEDHSLSTDIADLDHRNGRRSDASPALSCGLVEGTGTGKTTLGLLIFHQASIRMAVRNRLQARS